MQAVLKELEEMSPEEERAQWADWSSGFKAKFVANCVEQLPRLPYTPRMTEQFSYKLALLMGMKELEKIKKGIREVREGEDIKELIENPSENVVKIVLEERSLQQQESSVSRTDTFQLSLTKQLRERLLPEVQKNSGKEQ